MIDPISKEKRVKKSIMGVLVGEEKEESYRYSHTIGKNSRNNQEGKEFLVPVSSPMSTTSFAVHDDADDAIIHPLHPHHAYESLSPSSSSSSSSSPCSTSYFQLILRIYSSSTAMIFGNMLEWLDFGIYGYSEQEISRALFANNNASSAGWATFGLGYAFRPIGAYVLGRLADGDSNGRTTSTTTTTTTPTMSSSSPRQYSFLLAILGMAVSTACLSLLPSVCSNQQDDTIDDPNDDDDDNDDDNDDDGSWMMAAASYYCVTNVWKTALPAIVLRCIQGFSAGAAAGGVNVIQSEKSSSDPRLSPALAQSVGVNNVSGSAASLLSALVVFGLRGHLGDAAYAAWGWRLAFWVVIPPSAMAACLLLRDTTSHHQHHHPNGEEESAIILHEYELSTTTQSEHNTTSMINDSSTSSSARENGIISEELFHDEPLLSTISHRQYADVPSDSNTTLLSEQRTVAATEDSFSSPLIFSSWPLILASIYIQFAISSFNNLNIYMVQYAKSNYHVSSETATLLALSGKAVQLLLTPVAAGMADVYGWFGVCGASGMGCAILAMPLMAAQTTSLLVVWILVAGVLPIVSTFWISNAPLLATSIFPKHHRSQGTSLVMAMGTALAGFFPLVLNQIITKDGASSASALASAYTCGAILALDAALASAAIFWIRRRAQNGQVTIYQRPHLL